MSRPSWSLALVSLLGLAACSHGPEVNEERVATLSPTQLSSVRADEASVAQAQQVLAQREQERQAADKEHDSATDDVSQLKSALDAKDDEIEAKKKERDQLQQQLDTAKARVDAADAQVDWTKARIEAAQAEVAHQQALLDQSKYQALVNAKDASVQQLKAEDFAEHVRKSEEKLRDAQNDATQAQQRYQERRDAWQSQAGKN